jgi:hypothetical protein
MSRILILVFCLSLIGCGQPAKKAAQEPAEPTYPYTATETSEGNEGEPSHITVQHILIGFKGSVRGKDITRTKEEAEELAKELLAKAKAGEDFLQLVIEHTDDSPPGIYHMANFGERGNSRPARPEDMVFKRGEMVPAFGNTGFPLKVGETGLAEFDPMNSPFGWHIVKRIN